MTPEPNEAQPLKKAGKPDQAADSVVTERVAELSWALLDEQITADEMRLLDSLLLSDDEARRTYLNCVQLHTDLMYHFRQPAASPSARTGKSLVLGFLNEGISGIGVESPPSEGARS